MPEQPKHMWGNPPTYGGQSKEQELKDRIATLERKLAEAMSHWEHEVSRRPCGHPLSCLDADGDCEVCRALAAAQADSEKVLNYASDLLDGFDDGVFVRDVSRDNESGWAIRLIKPVAAMANLRAAIDEARKRDVT